MYAKLKSDGQIQKSPNPLRLTIANPSDERLEYEGYHRVIESEQPSYDPDTQYITARYEMDGNNIIQIWEVHDIEE